MRAQVQHCTNAAFTDARSSASSAMNLPRSASSGFCSQDTASIYVALQSCRSAICKAAYSTAGSGVSKLVVCSWALG